MQPIDLHLNAPRLRIDTWNSLAALTHEIQYLKPHEERCKVLLQDLNKCLDILFPIESYYAFPGTALCNKIRFFIDRGEFKNLNELISYIVLAMRSNTCNYKALLKALQSDEFNHGDIIFNIEKSNRYYFEVLVVEEVSEIRKEVIKQEIDGYFLLEDLFVYELVFVNSFQDALIAIMYNFNIKGCILTDFFRYNSDSQAAIFKNIISQANTLSGISHSQDHDHHPLQLAKTIRKLRQQELGLYYLSSFEPEKFSAQHSNVFDKIFYDFENYSELHLTIMNAIKNHFETPFFDSLKQYTYQPKSTFHALPVARGKSIFKSRWIHDMHDFYGKTIFLAESSATAGGLDSLMNPIGSIKRAMEKASRFFGSHETFFVTNGTSASNKIVLQCLLKPGDLVLIEHSCHESHHYGILLAGAYPIFLNGYEIESADIPGPVPLKVIKEQLLLLKAHNLLSKVKLVILTNCTFDGLVYNVQKYMEEILAIKPDMIFLWDEAWFAFARCIPHYRLRTAMFSASFLEEKYKSAAYLEEYDAFKMKLSQDSSDEFLLNTCLLPDPEQVKIRVFSTQSTHKTLSCLRQGSMIHVFDHTFHQMKEKFTHAFITFSTTSPNYQIIATMDLARRQAELEGYELVQHAIELSMIFRQKVNKHPLISQYFRALGPAELIPEQYRQSKVKSGYDPGRDWNTVERAWISDDIVIDPTRITLLINYDITGHRMRHILMDKFGIQVNKVSANTILLQFNIGTLRSSVSLLLDALFELAKELSVPGKSSKPPLLPQFTRFSPAFTPYSFLSAGDLRKAYYMGSDDSLVEYVDLPNLFARLRVGEEIVCASIIIPVPPGYPILLPGQIITESILQYLSSIEPSSILGGSLEKGLKIFTKEALQIQKPS